jgi:hypothetical protein
MINQLSFGYCWQRLLKDKILWPICLHLISLQKISQINYICSKLEEQMTMAPTSENLSAAPAQFIPALVYIEVRVEQE